MCTKCAVKPGEKAPFFSSQALMPSFDFETISLDEYAGKWLLLFSYPKDFTYVAPTEIKAFTEKLSEFEKINCKVLGISTDSVYVHAAWRLVDRKKGGLGDVDFPILGDVPKIVARQFGFFNEEEGCCVSGTCVINPKGVVMSVSYDSPDVGRSIDDAYDIVKQCQAITGRATETFSAQLAVVKKVEKKVSSKNAKNGNEKGPQTKCCNLI